MFKHGYLVYTLFISSILIFIVNTKDMNEYNSNCIKTTCHVVNIRENKDGSLYCSK